jgi:hypothetical protein
MARTVPTLQNRTASEFFNHPQSDGHTERVNQCLETYLRCAVHACPTNWFHWLHLAEYWYSLRPILLFANTNVSTTKTCLDTSILAKSIMSRREYNTSVHTAHGVIPFQVMFGRLPREFGTVQVDQFTVTDLAAWLREREIMHDLLKQQLLRAHGGNI